MNELVNRIHRVRRCCVLTLAVLVSLACSVYANDDEDDDDDDAGARGTLVQIVDGHTRIQLDPETLARFGITVAAPRLERHVRERLEIGETLDSAAILDTKNSIMLARAALDAAAAVVDGQRALIARMTSMRDQGIAVDTVVLAREQRQLTDFIAQQRRARLALESAHDAALLQWGPQFGARIVAPDDTVFGELLAGERHIVSVPVRRADAVGSAVFVGRSGLRAEAVAGNWLGADARSRTPLGTSYLLAVADPQLQSGMRVSVWLSNPDAAYEQLRVPRGALVWHAGARWMYVELDAGVFERRRAQVSATNEQSVLLEPGAEATSRVVVAGAASLLGEEFRWSIPDEDDD